MVESNPPAEGSVGTHWAHQKFAQNLINASRARDLSDASKEWIYHKIYVSKEWQNCQLCNTRIQNCVVLKNEVNGNYAVLGEDCYDKLLQFLKIGRVESALPSRGSLRSYWDRLLSKLGDRTVLGWLREELAAGRLVGEIASVVYTISRLGFAPTISDADMAIHYYKATRKFKRVALIDVLITRDFRHARFLPEEITIDEIDRVKKIIERDHEVAEHLLEVKQARAEVPRLMLRLEDSIAKLDKIRNSLEAIAKTGVQQAASGASRVKQIQQRMSELLKNGKTLENLKKVAEGAESTVEKQRRICEWEVADPEVILSVKIPFDRYILVKQKDRWEERDVVEARVDKGVVSKTGLYNAVVLGTDASARILLKEELDSSKTIVIVDFNEPSHSRAGTFVGSHHGKIVLPSDPVQTPGKYLVFLTSEEGKYYRAWVIDSAD